MRTVRQPGAVARLSPRGRLLLLGVGIVTPVGILVVNGSAFVMRHLAAFRLGIAGAAFISSVVLNGLAAWWLTGAARRRRYRLFSEHLRWVIAGAALLVGAISFGAAYFSYVGMREADQLPNSIAVITALLVLAIPLGFTYLARQLTESE